jgi:hypothetical protein
VYIFLHPEHLVRQQIQCRDLGHVCHQRKYYFSSIDCVIRYSTSSSHSSRHISWLCARIIALPDVYPIGDDLIFFSIGIIVAIFGVIFITLHICAVVAVCGANTILPTLIGTPIRSYVIFIMWIVTFLMLALLS